MAEEECGGGEADRVPGAQTRWAQGVGQNAGEHAGGDDRDNAGHLQVGGLNRRELEQAAREARHHQNEDDDAARENPGDNEGEVDPETRGAEHFGERELGKRLALAHLLEDRRFLKEAAQVDRDQAEDAAEHEGNAPCPVGEFRLRVDRVHREGDDGAQENAARHAGRQNADELVLVALRRMFLNEDPGAGKLTANRDALADSNEYEEDRRSITNRFIGRNHRQREGRNDHQGD